MNPHKQIPRPEYPRPQFVRLDWLNLNGAWSFEIDNGQSSRARGLQQAVSLLGEILVPFCPESRLSGVANTDFMRSVWLQPLRFPARRLTLRAAP